MAETIIGDAPLMRFILVGGVHEQTDPDGKRRIYQTGQRVYSTDDLVLRMPEKFIYDQGWMMQFMGRTVAYTEQEQRELARAASLKPKDDVFIPPELHQRRAAAGLPTTREGVKTEAERTGQRDVFAPVRQQQLGQPPILTKRDQEAAKAQREGLAGEGLPQDYESQGESPKDDPYVREKGNQAKPYVATQHSQQQPMHPTPGFTPEGMPAEKLWEVPPDQSRQGWNPPENVEEMQGESLVAHHDQNAHLPGPNEPGYDPTKDPGSTQFDPANLPPAQVSSQKYGENELRAMGTRQLKDIVGERGVQVKGTPSKDNIINAILEDQKRK